MSPIEQLKKKLKDLANQGANFVNPKIISPVPQRKPIQPQDNIVSQFGRSGVGKAITSFQKNIEQRTLPKVNLQPQVNKIQNPTVRTVAGFGASIAQDAVNLPQRLLEGGGRIGTQIVRPMQEGRPVNPRQAVGAVASAAEPIFDIATAGSGIAFKQAAKQGIKTATKQGLKKAVFKGAMTGAGYGATFGGLRGLSEGNEASFTKGIQGAAQGAVAGGIVGGGTAGLSGLIGLTRRTPEVEKQLRDQMGRWTKGQMPVRPKGMTKPQWDMQLQFNKKYNRNPYTPVYADDVKKAFGYEVERRGAGLSIRDVSKDKNPLGTQPVKVKPQAQIKKEVGFKKGEEVGFAGILSPKGDERTGKFVRTVNKHLVEIDYGDHKELNHIKNIYKLDKKPNVAQERITDTGKYYIRNGLNELVKAENAKPINLGNNVEAFSHKFGKDTSVVISEAKTGMQIATGKTEKEAIANAQKAFKDLRGITPQQLIERQLKSLESGIIKGTDGGIGRRNVGSLNTGQEAIPHKETYRFGSRPTMRGANPSSVNNSRLSQARPELDQLSGDGALPLSGSKTQLVRVGESNPKLTGVPSSEMSPDLLSRKIIPQSPQKSFTQPGSATNTRADQIAPKFRKPAPFEVEMDAQAGKPYEKPFTGKSKMKFKEPTTLPGDQATTDFATGRMAMGGNGVKGLPKNISDSFQQWVNTRRATQLEGVLKKKEFSDLNNKGIEGIFEFQSGNKTGRYGDVKKYFDAKYKTLQDNKIQFDFRQDYLPQLWANTPEEVSQVLGRRMGMKPSFTLDAVFKSYKEGIEAGLTPKFKNISDLTGWYEQKANKAIADKNFFDYLGKDGAILPSTKAPMSWETLDPDRFPKFLTQIGDEKFAGTYKAPKELADTINNYLRDGNGSIEKVANYVSGVKSIALNFGIPGTAINAHGVNILARHTLMGSGGNPISRFLKGANFMLNQKASGAELDKVITRAPKAMKDGLMLSSDDYSNRIVEATGLKQKFGKKWEEAFGGPLFNKMIPSLKISSYEELVKNGMDGKDAAKLVNNVYGGINWEQMGRSKDTQNLLRIAILAPDWAETTLRTGGNFVKAFNPKDRSMVMNRYRTMMATILGSYVAHNVVNKITSGHYSYENEPSNIFNIQIGYTEDGEKRYVRPYGTGLDMVRLPAEVAMGLFKGDFTGVTRLLRNRLSIPAGVFVGALTDQDYRGNAIGYRGTDKFGNPMSFEQRAGNIAAEGASLVGFPSFLKQAIASATGQQSLEAGLTQGFELPTRYQSPGNSKTQKYVGDVSELKGKDLYDIKSRFKGESPFSDNQKALINQGGINTLNEIMQLRDQKRQVNKSKDIEEKVVNGEMTEEEGQKALEEILKTSAPAAKAAPSGVSKADAAGLQFTSSSDGDVQQSNTSSDLGEEIAKNRVKISKKSERMGDKIIYPTEKGSATLDLSAPSKGNGIAAFSNKDWNITKAREVHNNDALSKEDKEYAFKKLGVEPEDARYDALASYTNDEKYQYLVSKSNTKEKLIENILTGRVRSIGDNIFASDGVIDTLVDEGKLTKEEGKKLKSIDYDKTGKLKVKTSKGKKLKIGSTPKLSAIEVKAPSKMQIIKFGGSSRKLQLKSRPVAQRPKLKLKIKKLTKPKLKVKSASKD